MLSVIVKYLIVLVLALTALCPEIVSALGVVGLVALIIVGDVRIRALRHENNELAELKDVTIVPEPGLRIYFSDSTGMYEERPECDVKIGAGGDIYIKDVQRNKWVLQEGVTRIEFVPKR